MASKLVKDRASVDDWVQRESVWLPPTEASRLSSKFGLEPSKDESDEQAVKSRLVEYWEQKQELKRFFEEKRRAEEAKQALKEEFRRLADEWLEDTMFISSPSDKFLHRAYLEIIGMGKDAIPFLLREVRDLSGHWFLALRSITKQDPVQPEDANDMISMADAWLRWGREKGHEI